MKKIIFFLSVFITASFWGQTPIKDTINANSWQHAMDITFGLLPKSHYPSGFLLDRGLLNIKMAYASGTLNDSSFNMLEWYNIQNTVRLSSNNPDSITGYLKLDSMKNAYIISNNILPWGFIDINAHVIRDSSFIDGSMIVSNHRIVENTSDLTKLYEQRKLFCVAPINLEVNTLNPQFVLLQEYRFTNNSNSIQGIQIDLDDSRGYQSVSFNVPFQASYTSGGFKQFLTRIIYTNGDTLYSRSELNVIDHNIQSLLAASYTAPDDTYIINGHSNGSVNDYPGAFTPDWQFNTSAEVGVWYGCGNNDQKLRKPFVIFAGYNPKDGKSLVDNGNAAWINDGLGAVLALDGWRGPLYQTYDGFYTDASKNSSFYGGNQSFGSNGNRFLDKVRQEGYDILIVRFHDGIGYLQHNAYLVSLVLEDLNLKIMNETDNVFNPGADLDPEAPGYPNSTKIKRAKHELVVAGYSAGALSTRMGLLLMEYENSNPFKKCDPEKGPRIKPHRTRIWIGMDHEAQGSNTPIGQQMFMDFQKSLWFLPANAADILNSLICSQALNLLQHHGVATQNTLYHIDNAQYMGSGNWNVGHHSDFDAYFNDLSSITPASYPANLKGYPRDCYRIAVSQGNANGAVQELNNDVNLISNESPTDWCINPLGTVFGVGNWMLKVSPYRTAAARVLTSWNDNAFTCKIGTNIRTVFYNWHVTFPHWKYWANNHIHDQYQPGNAYQTYDESAGSTLPSHIIMGTKLPLSSETYAGASVAFCNYKKFNHKQHGFSPTGSGLDLHLPWQTSLPRLPNLSLVPGNVAGGMNLMQQNKYNNSFDPSPNGDFGYPHLTFTNPYDYTPYDAIWANTTSDLNYDNNTMHVEDPNPKIGEFLAEEIAPYSLYLSNRVIQGETYYCGDNGFREKYYADFEARNSVLAGDQSIYQNNQSNPYKRVRTAPGNFVVGDGAVVTMRANNADGVSAVTLGAGFSSKHGSIFRAYVNGDSYCAPFSYNQRAIPAVNNYPQAIKESRPIYTKRAANQKTSADLMQKINVALYPNPTAGELVYVLNKEVTYDYVVTNTMGSVLQCGKISQLLNQINLSNLPKGVYFITINNKDYKQTDRIILQ